MRARYLLVTDVTENEGRRKTELLNHETRTLVSSECQEDRLGHMEGTTADGAHGGTFGGAPPKCVYLCVTWVLFHVSSTSNRESSLKEQGYGG